MSKKAVCMIYDTKADLVTDTDLREGMVCLILGRDEVNDGHAALYKIISKIGNNVATINGFDIGETSSYYAKLIADTNVTEILSDIREDASNAITEITNINTSLNTTITDLDRKIQGIVDHSSEIVYTYDISGDGNIVVYLTADYRKYLLVTTKSPVSQVYSIMINSTNKWLIPREFALTEVKHRNINDQVATIDYDEINKILKWTFTIKVPREYYLIEY